MTGRIKSVCKLEMIDNHEHDKDPSNYHNCDRDDRGRDQKILIGGKIHEDHD